MSYINNYGQSSGPIKIENLWLGSSFIEDNIYLILAKNIETVKGGAPSFFAPLMAATPSPSSPGNAVVTIDWIKAYGNLEGGGGSINLEDYAKKTELESLNRSLLNLQDEVKSIKLNIENFSEDINELKLTSSNLITINENMQKDIASNKNNISSINQKMSSLSDSMEIINKKVDSNSSAIKNNSIKIDSNTIKIKENSDAITSIQDSLEDIIFNSQESIDKVNEMAETIVGLQQEVNNHTDLISTNAENITTINKTLEEYKEFIDNPFADGLILVCGGAVLNAS